MTITQREKDLAMVALVATMAIKEYVQDVQNVILDSNMKKYISNMKTYLEKIENFYKKNIVLNGSEENRTYRLLKESKYKIKADEDAKYIAFCKQDIIFLSIIESALSYLHESENKMKSLDKNVKTCIKKVLGFYNAFINHIIKIGE
jgi:uncharacterized protein YqgV (UPF0045/DUF77 family)